MRRLWLLRGLLIVGWSLWTFVGWRLAANLPRFPGTPSVALDVGEYFDFWLPTPNEFVTCRHDSTLSGEGLYEMRVRDARTGAVLRKSPRVAMAYVHPDRRVALLFSSTGPDHGGNLHLALFDPDTVRTVDLGFRIDDSTADGSLDRFWQLHPERPWLALEGWLQGDDAKSTVKRLAVFDHRDGRMIGCLPPAGTPLSEDNCYCHPRFFDRTERIAVGHYIQEGGAVEIWPVPFGAKPERRCGRLRPFVLEAAGPRNGRFAWQMANGEDYPLGVVDLNRGDFVLRRPPLAERAAAIEGDPHPALLAPDSRTVVDWFRKEVVDVETGAVLWTFPADEDFDYGDRNGVYAWRHKPATGWAAWWNDLVGDKAPWLHSSLWLQPRTAGRAWRTGEPIPKPRGDDFHASPDGRWLIHREPDVRNNMIGLRTGIHALPLPFPWERWAPALAFLASPLLMIHAFVWWRCRRRRSA